MKFLGISSHYHDSAVAVIDESEILYAAQEERFSRVKGDSGFPKLAIRNLEGFLGTSSLDIDVVAYYENPKLKLNRILKTFYKEFPYNKSQISNFISNFERDRYFPIRGIREYFPESKIVQYGHHETHAASTFFSSSFDQAAVLVIDGVGEWATSSIYKGSLNGLNLIDEEKFPDSLGLFYATITSYCGFKVNSGEYKLMGLAPYGEPKYVKHLKENVIEIGSNGTIKLNMQYFAFQKELQMHSMEFEELVGRSPRKPESEITRFECDLARSAQVLLEEAVVKKALFALNIAESNKLALAGGVALNCVANSKILEHISAKNIYVQPASGDAGGALGAALLARKEFGPSPNKHYPMKGSFLGNSYSNQQIESALLAEGLVYEKYDEVSLVTSCVDLLVMNFAIGWFQGRMEFGPRALGGRSIIASAISSQTQSKLNLKVKKRESFRPFAPLVLADKVSEWFTWEPGVESPYMLFTAQVAPGKIVSYPAGNSEIDGDIDLIQRVNQIRSKIPAVTHIDFSARIQTVSETNPTYKLLTQYSKKTGIPILVNTSFNVRNEPIVESPTDAIRCFLTTDLDALAIGNFLLLKKDQPIEVLEKFKDRAFEGNLD